MIGHGTFPFARRKFDPKVGGKPAGGSAGTASSGASGFRHFMHDPKPEQRFPYFNGAHAGRSEHEVLHQLMGQLGERMSQKFDWPAHGVAGAEAWENPHIPSGYTYLLQLVAHDLVHSSVPMSIIEDSGSGMLNARRSGLRLDTIYGGGPMVCPLAYALDDKQDESRTKLRLGSIPDDPDIRPKGCPYRDIARVRPYGVNGDDRDPTRYNEPFPARTDPLIADPRNDAHVILSQMTALFHHLHNGILDLLPKQADKVAAESKLEAAHERYLCARGAATLIYRNVVRKDLMRLVLHPDVLAAYQKTDCRFLDETGRNGQAAGAAWSVPWEFSHGAFRFAHAMIRPHYRLNRYTRDATIREVIDTSSAQEPQNTPLRKEWLIQWSNFFAIDGSKPNLSRRIGPQYSAPLMKNPDIFPPLLEGSGGNGADPLSVGLAYRDLISSGLAGLWSVGAMIEEIKRERPDLIALSPLLSDPRSRVAALKDWLGRHPRSEDPTNAADLATLADNPPLPFFILFEAAMDPKAQGMRLGVLGSILVAEVVFGALQRDPLPFEVGAKSLKEALGRLSRSIYDDEKRLAGVPEIDSMDELIKFTARCADLTDANPAFV
jgi:hypothetical protein